MDLKAKAQEALAARRQELRDAAHVGRRDADLQCLVTEAASAFRRAEYRLAVSLLSDDSIARQRSLD